jgi:hypothetical protein
MKNPILHIRVDPKFGRPFHLCHQPGDAVGMNTVAAVPDDALRAFGVCSRCIAKYRRPASWNIAADMKPFGGDVERTRTKRVPKKRIRSAEITDL